MSNIFTDLGRSLGLGLITEGNWFRRERSSHGQDRKRNSQIVGMRQSARLVHRKIVGPDLPNFIECVFSVL